MGLVVEKEWILGANGSMATMHDYPDEIFSEDLYSVYRMNAHRHFHHDITDTVATPPILLATKAWRNHCWASMARSVEA